MKSDVWAARNAVKNGKSVCTCTHRGDGADSQHAGTVIPGGGEVNNGHGECLVHDCPCMKFSWHHFVADEPTLSLVP